MSRRIRLAALYSHPIQYAVPLFRELASRAEIDLTVYFCSRLGVEPSYDSQFGRTFKWDTPLLDGYRSVFLPNLRKGTATDGFWKLISPRIMRELRQQRYDALLVHGYEHATKWMAFLAARLAGTRLLMRGEAHRLLPRPWYIDLAKEAVLRLLFRQADRCLCIGSNNFDFYVHYGVPRNRLVLAPYSVDNAFFQQRRRELEPARDAIRRRLGVDSDAALILCVGKLMPVKRPLLLLKAFSEVRKRHACWLVFVGEGELRAEIEALVSREGIQNVVLAGFKNQSEVGEAYASADIFVLPSLSEQWGLAVNEAMNFGLPIVVSDRVGSARDLVRHGENGFVFPYDNAASLQEALTRLVIDADLRRRMGAHSAEIIHTCDTRKTADGIVTALRDSFTVMDGFGRSSTN